MHERAFQSYQTMVCTTHCQTAASYRNRINGSIFDCYLQLIGTHVPEVAALVSCYHLLREWKHDIAANESRYKEFMRVVTQRQSTLAPDSLEWLQLEELMADYKQMNTDRKTYKLVCKDATWTMMCI